MPTDDEFYDLWKRDVINHLQLIYKKGYDDAKQELKRKPLSHVEIYEIFSKNEWKKFIELTRAIEKAHGIGVDDE